MLYIPIFPVKDESSQEIARGWPREQESLFSCQLLNRIYVAVYFRSLSSMSAHIIEVFERLEWKTGQYYYFEINVERNMKIVFFLFNFCNQL